MNANRPSIFFLSLGFLLFAATQIAWRFTNTDAVPDWISIGGYLGIILAFCGMVLLAFDALGNTQRKEREKRQ